MGIFYSIEKMLNEEPDTGGGFVFFGGVIASLLRSNPFFALEFLSFLKYSYFVELIVLQLAMNT